MTNPMNATMNQTIPQSVVDNVEIAEEKPLVIYHANCADGFGAAWVFWNAMNKGLLPELEFHAGVYQKEPPDVTGRIVYLVDFSYKREVVIDMCLKAEAVWLIDHHKTAVEDLVSSFDAGTTMPMPANFCHYTDLERSGAMLAWDFLYNTDSEHPDGKPYTIPREGQTYKWPPKLLEHIQDRDLWRFKLEGTREIQADLFSHEYDFETWDKLMKATVTELLDMRISGAAILRKMDKDIKELLNVCQRTMVIAGWTVPVASLPYVYSSDAGHIMARDFMAGAQFAACYWDTSDSRVFSLRSCDNGMDVSFIAIQYGGGGHRNAAGFSVPRHHELAKC